MSGPLHPPGLWRLLLSSDASREDAPGVERDDRSHDEVLTSSGAKGAPSCQKSSWMSRFEKKKVDVREGWKRGKTGVII